MNDFFIYLYIKNFFAKKKFFYFGGIRIEDDVLITENGAENLTEGLPRDFKHIEGLMKK